MSDHSIAKKLQVTTKTVKNRIRNLTKQGVLQGFETHLSATFFNASHCWVSARLYGNEPEGKIVEELGRIDKVSFIMPTTENFMNSAKFLNDLSLRFIAV